MLSWIGAWIRSFREWSQQHDAAWAGWTDFSQGESSRFQAACETRLRDALADDGFELIERRVSEMKHDRSLWVEARISPSDLRVEIYCDTANILEQRRRDDKIFEYEGFLTPETLISEFVEMALQRARTLTGRAA